MHHRLLAVLAGGLVLAVPAAAEAATKTMRAGPPAADQRTLQNRYGSDVNAFFPTSVSIRRGDRVRFVPAGFHTAEVLGRGKRGTPLFSPTGTTANQQDAAGNPFWFNGQPNLGFTRSLLQGAYGKTVAFTGARSVNSGLPLADDVKPMVVRFDRTGTFTVLCNVHPDMKGTVRVRSRRSSVPSARSDARRVRNQVAAAKRIADDLAETRQPANTVGVGAAGRQGVDYFGFVPRRLTVPAGTTVDFKMPSRSREVHTVTFGPGEADKGTGYVGDIAKTFESPEVDPRGLYPSEPPGSVGTLTPGLHGNGFWNSGLLAPAGKIPNIPASSRLTFGQAGTYGYVCLIHPFMKGEVVVQ